MLYCYAMKVTAFLFVWAMVDSCSIMITIDSSSGLDCTSNVSLFANQSTCKDLETVLRASQALAAIIQQPEDCIEVNIMPGNYTITSPLRFSTNLVLSAAEISSGVQVTFQVPVNQSSEPFYVMVFSNVDCVVLNGIDFMNSPGIIGFENVTDVTIDSCSFRFAYISICICCYVTRHACTT